MSDRLRVLFVIPRLEPRVGRWATSTDFSLPPRDVAIAAAGLLAAGVEVRIVDQPGEDLTDAVVRREVKLWRADLVAVHAGGPWEAMDPDPDPRPLRRLTAGLDRAPVLVCGPLGHLYAGTLLDALPGVEACVRGPVTDALASRDWREAEGVVLRGGTDEAPWPDVAAEAAAPPLPAWHLLPLLAYDGGGPHRIPAALGPGGAEQGLAEVRHALRRGGARRVVFVDDDFLADADAAERVARGMLAAAPGVPWTCRVRADRLTPSRALALARGGCAEVVVTWPTPVDAAGRAPFDDPHRPTVENAVDVVRVTGMGVALEFVVGRPGHGPAALRAWQRWLRDRRIAVRPRVRIEHPTRDDPRTPTLEQARARAGCADNELQPRDVERAVRMLCNPGKGAAAA